MQKCLHTHTQARHNNEYSIAAILKVSKPLSEFWSAFLVHIHKEKGYKLVEMKWEGGEVAADPDKVYQFSQSGLFESANELCGSHVQQTAALMHARQKPKHTNHASFFF